MRSLDSSRRLERESPERRRYPLPRSRALVRDLLHFARGVPSVPHSREFDLREVVALRSARERRISWPLMFLKAYGLVSRDSPPLRQCLLRYPWPHLYLHPCSVGYLAMRRTWQDEEWLFFAGFPNPEGAPLDALQERLDRYRDEPPETVFRIQERAARLPTWLRRLFMGIWLHGMGRRRSRRFGTFGLTTVSGYGAEIQFPPNMLTATLTYGPIDDHGRCRVTMHYDHRLMDGWYVAQVLEQLESALRGPVADELRAAPA